MTILFWLTAAFGSCTFVVGLAIRSITVRAVRWREETITFSSPRGVKTRILQDVVDSKRKLWGNIAICFRDGSALEIDPLAVGADELFDAIAGHLNTSPSRSA